jgi:HlyD family secretion protein
MAINKEKLKKYRVRAYVKWRALHSTFKLLMFGHPSEICEMEKGKIASLQKEVKQPLLIGGISLGVVLVIFLLWGMLAPLDKAAIASGYIVVSGNHKTVQHQEGGIIKEILVKEGDQVEENQVLLTLNDTQANARMEMLLGQLRAEKAVEARLMAEKEDKAEISFDDPVFDRTSRAVDLIIVTQNSLFEARSNAYRNMISILRQKIAQYAEQSKGFEGQSISAEAQAQFLKEELDNFETLFKRGLTTKSRLLELRRRYEEMASRKADIISRIATVKEEISEAELQIVNVKYERHKEINAELRVTQTRIFEINEQYKAAVEVLDRTRITAPSSGVINNLQYNTVGGVIAPGSKLMDIVPQEDTMLVEAHIMTNDIENVKIGMLARVQLGAYKSRLVPRIDGKVVYISADKVMEPYGNQPPYFIARIELDMEALKNVNYEINLSPGMPAQVFLVKGSRTFADYLLSPITESFHKAFKES